jgi:NADH-quinone oxidoreductase subunit K
MTELAMIPLDASRVNYFGLLGQASAPVAQPFSFDLLTNYLYIGAALMAFGMLGFLSRRNLIVMFLSAEMMLQGTALTLVGFGRYHGNWTGMVLTIAILTVAACEAALALALILELYKHRPTLDVTRWQDLRESGLRAAPSMPEDAEPVTREPGADTYPQLTPAGVEPPHPLQPWEERRD